MARSQEAPSAPVWPSSNAWESEALCTSTIKKAKRTLTGGSETVDLQNTSPNTLHPSYNPASISGSGRVTAAQSNGDADNLYRDLLRKAGGNRETVARWIDQLASSPGPTQARSDTGSAGPDDLDTAAVEAGAPTTFFCPISFRVFRDPVVLPTGQTYERQYIERWLADGNATCPASGQTLVQPVAMMPNVALRKSIEEWAEKHAIQLLAADGHLKPIADADSTPQRPSQRLLSGAAINSSSRPAAEDDVALALRLQQQEAARYRSAADAGPRMPPPLPYPHPPLPPAAYPAARPADRRRGCCSALTLVLYLLSAVQTTMYILALWRGGWDFVSVAINPLLGPGQQGLVAVGAGDTARTVYDRQWWRVLSSPFTTAGLIQLFLNAAMLWTFGQYLGRVLILPWLSVPAIYVISGIMGALASANLAVRYVSTGSSACVCGLVGACWLEQVANWRLYQNRVVTLVVLVLSTAAFVVVGLLPFVDNFFNIGGLVVGALLVPLLLEGDQESSTRREKQRWWRGFQVACLAVLAGLVVVGAIGLARDAGVGQGCGWCNSFACVHTKWWTCTASEDQLNPSCKFQTFTQNSTSTIRIECPTGSSSYVNGTAQPSQAQLVALCNQHCTASPAPTPSGLQQTTPGPVSPSSPSSPATASGGPQLIAEPISTPTPSPASNSSSG